MTEEKRREAAWSYRFAEVRGTPEGQEILGQVYNHREDATHMAQALEERLPTHTKDYPLLRIVKVRVEEVIEETH